MAIIGKDENTNYLQIGDHERRSGLYILGKPRMRKSWLLVNLILQDIEKGHGIFFLDPHGDAIKEVLEHSTSDTSDMLLLDQSNKDETFGINPLFCSDISDIQQRDRAFNKTKGIFDKLWKETFEYKPWLQMILQNTILAFIENTGLTLIEFPIFFRNTDFRHYIISNIRYNWQVRDYWNLTFDSKSKRLQEEQLVAAETRAHNMLTIPYVSDIVGQSRSTIDFAELIAAKRIILVNLSNQLSYEARRIIGTTLISELLHAIEQRPANKRDQFCIYVDEFHNFAAYQDFSTLITDAPKFGLATTLAHHERAGQLSGQPRMMGATAAIANKVLFQITGNDAEELSREFAQEPETETRYEETHIISREPVLDLLRWHDNRQIREFVNKYIRPLKERLVEIKGEQETEKLIRSQYIDEANLYRITDVLEGAGRFSNVDPDRQSLSSAGRLINAAKGQTRRLMTLGEEITHIDNTFMALNKLFCSIMEGTIDIRSGEFINYLVTGITTMAGLTDIQRKAIAFYLTVKTAEWYVVKVPFDIAQAYGLFPQQVPANQKEVDDEWQKRKLDYMEEYRKCSWFDYRKLDHYVDPQTPLET